MLKYDCSEHLITVQHQRIRLTPCKVNERIAVGLQKGSSQLRFRSAARPWVTAQVGMTDMTFPPLCFDLATLGLIMLLGERQRGQKDLPQCVTELQLLVE